MLDKLTASVLGIVNAESGGAYKVMETDDFIAALPAEGKTDAAGVANALQYLSERGSIDIRYSDRGTYCVCSLPKGRTYEEGAEVGKRKQAGAGRSRLRFLPAFLGGFIGAFAGGFLAWLVCFYFLI